MDPLSAAASIITLAQAATALQKGYRVLQRFVHAADEIAALLNELATLQQIIYRIQRMLDSTEQDYTTPITGGDIRLVKNLCDQILLTCHELDDIASQACQREHSSKRQSDKKINKRRWVRLRTRVLELQKNARRARELLDTSLHSLAVAVGQNNHTSLLAITSIVEQEFSLMQAVSQRMDDLQRAFQLQGAGSKEGKADIGDAHPPESDSVQVMEQMQLGTSFQGSQPVSSVWESLPHGYRASSSVHRKPERASGAIIAIDTIVIRPCEASCRCHCHRLRHFRTSPWLRSICGVFLTSYNSLPVPSPPLCIPECHNRSDGSLRLTYFFPRWLLLGCLSVTLSWVNITDIGATLHLSLPGSVLDPYHFVWPIIETGMMNGLQYLVAHKQVCPNDTYENGATVLQYAVSFQKWDMARFLLEQGARPSQTDCVGSSAAMIAYSKLQCLPQSQLRDSSSTTLWDISGVDMLDENPVHAAAKVGDIAILEKFLTLRADEVQNFDVVGWTPLHYTAKCGQLEAMKLILSFGASVNQISRCGRDNPLILASREGYVDICRTLISAGTSVNEVNIFGHDALAIAAEHCQTMEHVEILRLLLANGANVHHINCDGRTALHLLIYGARLGNDCLARREGLRCLLTAGSDMEARKCARLFRPLHVACLRGWAEGVKILVDAGAEMAAKCFNKWSSLHCMACMCGRDLFDELEIDDVSGLDPDEQDRYGKAPEEIMRLRRSDAIWADGNRPLLYPEATPDDVASFKRLLDGIRKRNWARGLYIYSRPIEQDDDKDLTGRSPSNNKHLGDDGIYGQTDSQGDGLENATDADDEGDEFFDASDSPSPGFYCD